MCWGELQNGPPLEQFPEPRFSLSILEKLSTEKQTSIVDSIELIKELKMILIEK